MYFPWCANRGTIISRPRIAKNWGRDLTYVYGYIRKADILRFCNNTSSRNTSASDHVVSVFRKQPKLLKNLIKIVKLKNYKKTGVAS